MKYNGKISKILMFLITTCVIPHVKLLSKEPHTKSSSKDKSYLNKYDKYGWTQLANAIDAYHEDKMEDIDPSLQRISSLLSKGADPNFPNKSGSTPLEQAVGYDLPEVIALLLKYGADVNKNTSLMGVRSKKVFDLLLEAGAHVDNEKNEAKALFRKGIQSNVDPSLLIELLKYHRLDKHNPEDQTLLFSILSTPQLIAPFFKAGANLEAHNEVGNTPLIEAATNNYAATIKELLSIGAQMHAVNAQNETPLIAALSHHPSGEDWAAADILLNAEIKALNDITNEELKNKKAYAQALFTKLSALQNSVELDDENFRKDVTQGLSILSRKFSLTSGYKPAPFQKSDLVTINDISVVDTSSIKDPSSFLSGIARSLTRPLTQTQAYLSLPGLRYIVLEDSEIAIQNYPKLIKRIIEQEEKLKDYDVFYHGQERDFIVFYDVIKEIQNWFNDNSEEFEYVRLPSIEYESKKLSEFTTLGELMIYKESALNKYLLSVNLSLFGNSGVLGEDTFAFFISSHSEEPPKNLLTKIFKEVGINTNYVKEILNLIQLIKSPTGNLLQIFIPRDKVNDYVYISGPYGVPVSKKNPLFTKYSHLEFSYKPIRVTKSDTVPAGVYDIRKIDARTYLDLYRSHFDKFSPDDLNRIQGRISITKDFLLNPKSGVKIFRYNTVHPDKMREYRQKLREIMTRAMSEWQETHKGISPQQTITQLITEVEKIIGTQAASPA